LLSVALFACGGGQAEPATADHAAGHPGHGGGHGGAAHQHDFSDVERFATLFDDPERDAWQNPTRVVERLRLVPGMTVADLGAGTGYFIPHLSPAVGPEGRVLALDVEPNMVAHMEERIAEAGIENAEARVVPADAPGLEPASVDRILIVDTWHHIQDRGAYAARLRDTLRPGGFVLVVDFKADAPHGPPPAMRLPPETVAAELEAGGFVAEIDEQALPYQYLVLARPE
jgi:predicted methyltransferase